jgi:hypothetical protein
MRGQRQQRGVGAGCAREGVRDAGRARVHG